jgi:hypothetical protein
MLEKETGREEEDNRTLINTTPPTQDDPQK